MVWDTVDFDIDINTFYKNFHRLRVVKFYNICPKNMLNNFRKGNLYIVYFNNFIFISLIFSLYKV